MASRSGHLLRQLVHEVFHGRFGGAGLQVAAKAGVGGHQDQVGTLVAAEFGDGRFARPPTGRRNRYAPRFSGFSHSGISVRGHADDRDLDAAYGLHDVGGERALRAEPGEARVGGEPGEVGVAARAIEIGQADVEFVIAEGHGVVVEQVHGAHHWIAKTRVARGRRNPGAEGLLVDAFQRGALDGVAAIDQDGVRILRADGADESGEFGETAWRGAAGHIVHGHEVAVQIGGGQDGHRDRRGVEQAAQKQGRDEPSYGDSHYL